MVMLGCLLLVLVSCQLAASKNGHDIHNEFDSVTATPDPLCQNGIRSGSSCCTRSCGTCGGSGCSQRPGGATNCCTSHITKKQNSCMVTSAPCQIPSGDSTCCTGVTTGKFCCAASCETCGGSGCSGRPGGPDACCTSNIGSSGRLCDLLPPPCNLD